MLYRGSSMPSALSWGERVHRMESLQAPISLISGPDSAGRPHVFRCNLCNQTFSRSFSKVCGKGQFSCYTLGCPNNRLHCKPVTTEQKAIDAFAKYGAVIVSSYRGAKHKVTFRCKCGALSEIKPDLVIHGGQRPYGG